MCEVNLLRKLHFLQGPACNVREIKMMLQLPAWVQCIIEKFSNFFE